MIEFFTSRVFGQEKIITTSMRGLKSFLLDESPDMKK